MGKKSKRARVDSYTIMEAIPPAWEAPSLYPDGEDVHPIAKAVTCSRICESLLEELLKTRLRIKADAAWRALLSPEGCFSNFSQKIVAAEAIGIVDKNLARNLKILLRIRNGFAHSRIVFDFDHPGVLAELDKVYVRPSRRPGERLMQKARKSAPGANKFQNLYTSVCLELLQKMVKSSKSRLKKLQQKIEKRDRKADEAYWLHPELSNPALKLELLPQGGLLGLGAYYMANKEKFEKK